jgi:hypothetical protein
MEQGSVKYGAIDLGAARAGAQDFERGYYIVLQAGNSRSVFR